MATFEVTFEDRKKTLQITTQAISIQGAMEEIWDIVGVRPSSMSRL